MSARYLGRGVALAILAFGLLLVALLWTALFVWLETQHKTELDTSARHGANLARAAQEHALRTLREADQVLVFLRRQYGQLGHKLDLRGLREDGTLLSNFYVALGVSDEHGRLILGSRPLPPAASIADRDYFRVHADGDASDRPYVSRLLRGRVSGEALMQLSRRISRPDGSFGGVIFVAINPEYFERFYDQLDVGARGMTTLVGRDREVRAQRAGGRLSAGPPDASRWAVFKHLETAESGSYISASTIDSERRIFTYHALRDYPLVAVVGVLEQDALAEFRERKSRYYVAGALVSAAILAMSTLLAAFSARQARMARDFARQNAELAGAERRFEALFRASPMPSRIFADDGTMLDCNAAFCALVGRSREELVGRKANALGLFADPAASMALGRRMRAGERIDGAELDVLTAARELRRVALTAQPLAWQGRSAWISQYMDVTERRQAEEALRQSEARFVSLFHNSLVPQVVSNPESRIAENMNQAYVELVGYSREQMLSRPGSELGLYWGADDLEKVTRIVAQRDTPEPVEVRLRRADGAQRVVLVKASTIETASGPRIAWSLIDVTEQRESQRLIREMNQDLERKVVERTEELSRANAELTRALESLKSSQDALLQSQKLAALGRLVAGVAHELNTPIGNALLASTTFAERSEAFAADAATGLRRSALDGYVLHVREAAQILQRNLQKAAHLIQSFKQVAADQASSQRRSFALREAIEEVLLAHRPMLKKSPIEVGADVPEGIRLDSYPGPLGQVLGNLIMNAVLHGYEGRSAGRVTVSARLDGADTVEIAVLDEGRGITETDLKRIFEPFFTTKLGRGGTGLGLAICHRIVTESLGGTLRASSRFGQGTAFILRIPVRAPAAESKEAA